VHDSYPITEYRDDIHAEDTEGLLIGEFGYKYRMLDGVVMPPYVTPDRYRLSRELQTRPGDICYVSYPKSGSTWLAYILVLIVNRGNLPTDKKTLRDCLHWVESSWTYPRSASELEGLPSTRIFKSHMPYAMALGGNPVQNPCKYVYIARNPKDVAVSYYYFERQKSWSGHYCGSWEHWLEIFMEGRVQRGSWFDHALSWWQHRDAENILFLTYEELRGDFRSQLCRLMEFLGFAPDEEIIEKIVMKTSFRNMQNEKFSNMHEIKEFQGFFREGKVASWKDQFTAEQSEAFDRFYLQKTRGSGLTFDLG